MISTFLIVFSALLFSPSVCYARGSGNAFAPFFGPPIALALAVSFCSSAVEKVMRSDLSVGAKFQEFIVRSLIALPFLLISMFLSWTAVGIAYLVIYAALYWLYSSERKKKIR